MIKEAERGFHAPLQIVDKPIIITKPHSEI